MLTLKDLKAMQPGLIFRSGTAQNSPKGIFMTREGGQLRWVAVRGDIWDWAIYCHWVGRTEVWIKDHGDKVTNKETIRKLVPCNDEAFKMYRY